MVSGDGYARPVLGAALQVAAVVVVVALLGGAVVGWRLLGTVEDATDRSTRVALAALDAVDGSLATADGLLVGAHSTLVAAVDTLREVGASLEDGTEVITSVGELAETSAPALEATRETLQNLEGVGRGIDATLGALSQLPVGPEYDPAQGFGATVAQMVDDLEPLPGALRSTARELDDLTANGALLEQDLGSLTAALDEVAAELEGSEDLVVEFRAAADEARLLAEDSGELGVDLALGRVLVVAGALALALVQAVPFLYGAGLRRGRAAAAGDARR